MRLALYEEAAVAHELLVGLLDLLRQVVLVPVGVIPLVHELLVLVELRQRVGALVEVLHLAHHEHHAA